MLRDEDIIQLVCDPRFERAVLALLRRRLQFRDDEKPLLNKLDGYIPIGTASLKYEIPEARIQQAIRNRHVLAHDTENGRLVDEMSLRVWRFGTERPKGFPGFGENEEEVVPTDPGDTCTLKEAAELLGLPEERVAEHVLAGTLQGVGTHRVAYTSVLKHKRVLEHLGGTRGTRPVGPEASQASGHEAPGAPDPDANGCVSVADAARFLGCDGRKLGAFKKRGALSDPGKGLVVWAEVLALDLFSGKPKARSKATPASGQQAQATTQEAAPTTENKLTTAEACARYGITSKDVANWKQVGHLSKEAGRGMVYTDELEAYLTKRGRTLPAPILAA